MFSETRHASSKSWMQRPDKPLYLVANKEKLSC